MNFKIFEYSYFNLFFIAFSILSIWSCETPNEPGNPKLNYSVLFNLTANADSQKIYIYRIADIKEYINNDNLGKYFVKTAKISLSNSVFNYSNFTVKDIPQENYNLSKGAYYTNTDSLQIYPSTQYYLNININRSKIDGYVTTPGDFNIISPIPNSTVKTNDNINFTWSSSYNAKGYIVNKTETVVIRNNDSLFTYFRKFSFLTQDTTFVYHNISPDITVIKIDVLAFDENYYNHIIKNIPGSYINGSYGYLAAMTLKSVTVNIR